MLLIIACASFFLCLSAISYALMTPALRANQGPEGLNIHRGWALIWPWFSILASGMRPWLSWKYRIKVEQEIILAGRNDNIQPSHVAAMGCVAGMLTAAGSILVFKGLLALGWSSTLTVSVMLSLASASLPRCCIRKRGRERQKQILKQLPFFLDLLTLNIEGGMNFHAELIKTADMLPQTPLKVELLQTLLYMKTGASRTEALENLCSRTQLKEIKYFAASVNQAARLGTALGPVLRLQSAQRRKERFLKAEKLALQAPVKMLFPLVSCFFPCTFIVLMFPVAMKFLAYAP